MMYLVSSTAIPTEIYLYKDKEDAIRKCNELNFGSLTHFLDWYVKPIEVL